MSPVQTSVHLGTGGAEFCDYALADGVGALLSRISPKKEESSPKESRQDLLPGFI